MTDVVETGHEPEVSVALGVEEDDGDIVAGKPQSPLEILAGRRKDLESRLFLDLAVPRWEDVIGKTIWVRYRPANIALLTDAQRTREQEHLLKKRKDGRGDPQWAVKANADMLRDACVGVYFLEVDEEPPRDSDTLDADLPTFSDPALSVALDAPRSAVATVLKLYGTDADVLMAAQQLVLWSGEASKEAHQEALKA